MSEVVNTDFWRVLRPKALPQIPLWMSFSTLMDLEDCPLRWSLTNAEYLDLWRYHGYPSLSTSSALEGMIVHKSLQKITSALVERGCTSLIDESAILTLRHLGGYTAIIIDCLERVLIPYKENPRVAPVLEGIRTRLVAKVPELRMSVQRFLSRIRLKPCAVRSGDIDIYRGKEPRHALQDGSYTEVLLKASDLGWRGIADMLTLSVINCEIKDFKTGVPKEEHKEQLLSYALLWARDRDLNPTGRLADNLVLSYYDEEVDIPAPSLKELHFLEVELRNRTANALADLQANPPETRLSLKNCAYCAVRHLCDDYWKWYTQSQEKNKLVKSQLIDGQVKILGQHGPRSWDCVVESGMGLECGKPVLLRIENLQFNFRSGQRFRLLNVFLNTPDEESDDNRNASFVVTMRTGSEAFLLL
jgi:hypothetical protein